MSKQDGSVATFKILKALLDGQKQSDIARDFNVSRQWISAIKRKAIDAGFDLRKSR
jgi:transcriptional regulator